MNNIFKDKIFLFSILIVTFASGIFITRKIAHFVSPSQVHHHTQKHSHPQAARHTYTPVSKTYSPSQRSVASNNQPAIPVHKPRPKNADTWLVGTSAEADSNDLKAVLLNVQNNDIVQLEAGTYSMNVSDVPVSKLQILGRDNVIIEYQDSYQDFLFTDLTFKDLEIDFGKVKYSSAHFSAYDAKITFERVKAYAAGKSFRMRFSGNMEFEAKSSQFKGITLDLEGTTKTKISDSVIEKSDYLVQMEGTAELDIQTTTLEHFEWSAFRSQSPSVKISGNNINVSNGREGFYGKFIPGNVNIQHSKFSNLTYFQNRDSDISCYMCEKENVQK